MKLMIMLFIVMLVTTCSFSSLFSWIKADEEAPEAFSVIFCIFGESFYSQLKILVRFLCDLSTL